ncbi:MAG: hypothetical protein U5K75_09015 [Ahrensia sp.]|nr:hypothetical protein [Ahrensia sp.]
MLAREAGVDLPEGQFIDGLVDQTSMPLIKSALQSVDDIHEDNNWMLTGFAAQCVVASAEGFVTRSDLRAAFKVWCHSNGRDVPSKIEYSAMLRALDLKEGARIINGKSKTVWNQVAFTKHGLAMAALHDALIAAGDIFDKPKPNKKGQAQDKADA